MIKENGPQRAARRAQRNGLTVGESVRDAARANWGLGAPPPNAGLRSERTYGGAAAATPLDFAQRLERYAGQACARQGAVGWKWRPTARQRRRMRHKSNHAHAPFGRDYIAEMEQASKSHLSEMVTPVERRTAVAVIERADDGLDAARYAVAGAVAFGVPYDLPPQMESSVDVLPGMWEQADLTGGETDSPARVAANSEYHVRGGFRINDRRREHRA